MELPKHLGGHTNKTHVDHGAFDYFKKEFGIKSFVDVGCGPGGMVEYAISQGAAAIGVDGDFTIKKDFIFHHDFTEGPVVMNRKFDLAWSVEFVEHVEEKYVDNFMRLFCKAKYICITHAPKNKRGHHHVNCQDSPYWKKVFQQYGLRYCHALTSCVKLASTMEREFIKNTGMVFLNTKFENEFPLYL